MFAGLTLLGALWGDWVSLALGVGLSVIAWNELRGAAKLRRLDAEGARLLGYNQIGLGALIVGYAAWSLRDSLRDAGLGSLGGTTGNPQVDAMVAGIARTVSYSLYGGIMVVGVIVPGLTCWYYFTRGPAVRQAVAQTPPWVIEALRAAG